MAITPPKTAAVKVGILTIVSFICLFTVVIWLQGNRFQDGRNYSALFRDVDGLQAGAPVQLMGIRVGFVDKVEPAVVDGKYYVRVAFTVLDEEAAVQRGSVLSLEQSGLVGEKFLEITPPLELHTSVSSLLSEDNPVIPEEGMPVQFHYKEGWLTVGTVSHIETLPSAQVVGDDATSQKTQQYVLNYKITLPGARLPKNPINVLTYVDPEAGGKEPIAALRVSPSDSDDLVLAPDKDLEFTIENPVRMKEFLEIQLASAESLRATNEKVSKLLDDETIATLNATLHNVEGLTIKGNQLVDTAEKLMQATQRDLEVLVAESRGLSRQLTEMTHHVNDVVGNPEFKQDLAATMESIQESTDALNDILADGSIQETLAMSRDASRSIASISANLDALVEDPEVQNRLDESLTLLNESLSKLTIILDQVDSVTSEDETLKTIVEDTQETSENLKKFSQKLNKRFLLFRLLF